MIQLFLGCYLLKSSKKLTIGDRGRWCVLTGTHLLPSDKFENLQGDVIAVTDENGEWLVTYTYDAWGNFTANYNYANSELGQKISYAVDLPFRYRSYYYDWQTGFYYLNSRYYDAKLYRFINADHVNYLGINGDLNTFNLYAYCCNNPVICQVIVNIKDLGSPATMPKKEINFIKYDVPLYYQGEYSLCWAFCIVMIHDFKFGIKSSNKEATELAIEKAKKYHNSLDEKVWNNGAHPDKLGEVISLEGITEERLLGLLYDFGPMYVSYLHSSGNSGHAIVITGLDILRGEIYTNNPWNISGTQTLNDFIRGFVGSSNITVNDYMIRCIVIIDNEWFE